MPQYETLLPLAAVPPGSMRACVIGGREIVICHTREGVFALDNICTHAHARLCEGRLRATRLVAPSAPTTLSACNSSRCPPDSTCTRKP